MENLNNLKSFIFMDLEFIPTVFYENKQKKHLQEIIEIGAICTYKDMTIPFQHIVRPRFYLHIHKTNSIFNKLSDQELEFGRELDSVLAELKLYYRPGRTVLLTWGPSDFYVLNSVCKSYNIDNIFGRSDYMDMSECFRKFYSLRETISLTKAMKKLGIFSSEDRHRAMPDAEILYRIFMKMVSDGYDDEFLHIYS